MYKHFCSLLILSGFLVTGCTKDFTIHPQGSTPFYVIEGRISNLLGPYYIRVTRSTDSLGKGFRDSVSWLEDVEAVKGAEIILSDDMGVSDTLQPASPNAYRYTYRWVNGQIDSSLEPLSPLDASYTYDQGYYETKRIVGIPGHTYHLQVRIGGQVFQATTTMPPAAPEIDSAILAYVNTTPGTKTAFISFKEPQNEKNYYLLQLAEIYYYRYDAAIIQGYGQHSIFPYYVFDDRALSPYVSRMEVDAYISDYFYYGRIKPYDVFPDETPQVRLGAINSETYNYFNTLTKQFLDDGNAYKPAPASAKGNVSGGALGLFWATAFSTKLIYQ